MPKRVPPRAVQRKFPANENNLTNFLDEINTLPEVTWSKDHRWKRVHGIGRSGTDGSFHIETQIASDGSYQAKIVKSDILVVVATAGSPKPSEAQIRDALRAAVDAMPGRAAPQEVVQTGDVQQVDNPANQRETAKTTSQANPTNQASTSRLATAAVVSQPNHDKPLDMKQVNQGNTRVQPWAAGERLGNRQDMSVRDEVRGQTAPSRAPPGYTNEATASANPAHTTIQEPRIADRVISTEPKNLASGEGTNLH